MKKILKVILILISIGPLLGVILFAWAAFELFYINKVTPEDIGRMQAAIASGSTEPSKEAIAGRKGWSQNFVPVNCGDIRYKADNKSLPEWPNDKGFICMGENLKKGCNPAFAIVLPGGPTTLQERFEIFNDGEYCWIRQAILDEGQKVIQNTECTSESLEKFHNMTARLNSAPAEEALFMYLSVMGGRASVAMDRKKVLNCRF